MEFIRPFMRLGKEDAAIAGGKGASLGELSRAGIPVPPGFVILAGAFDTFLRNAGLIAELEAILASVDHNSLHTVEAASEKIKAIILNAEIPTSLANDIESNFTTLGSEYVAVRSSATAEDGASHAWAGQLDTYLNTTAETLLENVKRCWASLFTPRAIFYRFEKGLHGDQISVAVVVQKMVQSEVSGIAFSVHPVTEDRNQMVIEAGFGLGEAIVSGQVTPDSFVVEKSPRRIIEKSIAYQKKALWRAKAGGNEWRNLNQSEGEKPALSEMQVLELAEIALRIERHYGFPCDIEWAFEAGQFFITQSRPITTLSSAAGANQQIVLTKMFERERSLLYFSLWNESDRKGLANFVGLDLKHNLFIIPPRGRSGSVWHDLREIDALEARALKEINSNKQIGNEMIKHTRSAWDILKKFLDGSRHIQNPNDLVFFYETQAKFWYAMNTVYFRLPDRPDIDVAFKEAVLELRNETQEYSDRMGHILPESFERIFPAHAHLSYYVTPQDVEALAKNPSKIFLAELEKRAAEGCFLLDGQLHTLSSLPEVLQSAGLVQDLGPQNVSEFQGTVAYPGRISGRVRVIARKSDLESVEQDEILVSAFTDPDYISAMRKAAAYVTDEGGVMSRAAILAREMKKPCIIGTKYATQILKDGDFVEVDANAGIVRIIARAGASKKYTFIWGNFEFLRCIENNYRAFTEMRDNPWNQGSDEIEVVRNFRIRTYAGDEDLKRDLQTGKMFLQQDLYEDLVKKMEEALAYAWQTYRDSKKVDLRSLNDQELFALYERFQFHWADVIGYFRASAVEGTHALIESIKPHFSEEELAIVLQPIDLDEANKEALEWYDLLQRPLDESALLEHADKFPWQVAVHTSQEEAIKTLAGRYKNDHEFGKLRPTIIEEKLHLKQKQTKILSGKREIVPLVERLHRLALSRMEIKAVWAGSDYYLIPIVQELARRTKESASDIHHYYFLEEVRDLILSCKKITNERKEARKKCFVALLKDAKAYYYEGEVAEKIASETLASSLQGGNSMTLSGTPANLGTAQGKVRVLLANDVEQARHFRETFRKGEILVTEMTQPNIIDIAQRAGAIITDEGSMLSHAAIISREFGIPCIVNTKVATQVLKDGQHVSVDAIAGTVTILE